MEQEIKIIKKTVMVNEFASDLHLEVILAGRGMINLDSISVNRPGLQLTGFYKYFNPSRILVIGLTEYEYIRSLPPEKRFECLSTLLSYKEIPCVIISRDLPIMPEFIDIARNANCPIFRSGKVSTELMNDLYLYLNDKLAPSTSVHGVLMEVFGVGILITGTSGVGKSETAMELIKRGHRLVADDSVLIRKIGNDLIGTAPEMIRYFMELRGIGIINVKNMYGSGSILNEKKLELVIELEAWQSGKTYDRIGTADLSETILGKSLAKHIIPVSPGRNLAIIIEVAARNYRLESIGYDAAAELIQRTIGR